MGTYIVGGIVAIVVALIICNMAKKKKQGKGVGCSCSGGCGKGCNSDSCK